jgi:histidine kinase/DNA gyrase B/HSP90-like ATPase
MTEKTYLASVELAMQRSYAAFVAVVFLAWSATLLSVAERMTPALQAVGVAVVGLLAAEFVRGWRARLGLPDVLAATTVAVGLFCAVATSAHVDMVVGLRCQPAVLAAVLAGGLLPRRVGWPWCAAICVGQIASSWPVDGAVGAIEGVWPVMAAAVAAGMVVDAMRMAGANADRSQQAVLRVRAREADATGRRAAHRAFQRVLHDDVTSALRGVRTWGPGEPDVRSACAAAVEAAARAPVSPGPDATADLRAGLADVLARHAPAPSIGTAGWTGPLDVPAPVAGATLRAAAEVVRNVERHARATSLAVSLSGDADDVTLTISDDGVGFDRAVPASSVGLRRSVFDGMADIGGHATVRSAPGRGTTVTLAWRRAAARPAPAASTVVERIALAVGDVRRPLVAVCVPYLVGTGLVAVAHVDDAPSADWLLAGYVLMSVATLVLLRRADRPVRGWAVAVVAACSLGGVITSLRLVPPESIDDYGSWPIGALTPLLVVMITIRPVWETVFALAVEEVAVVIALGQGELVARSVTDVLPALSAPTFGVAMGYVVTRTLARLGAVVLDANAVRAAIVEGEAAREARAALHRQRMGEIGAEILPFLRRIAAGRELTGVVDPRGHARLLEAMARDELHVPGVLDAATREQLWRARASGCTVTIQSDTDAVEPPMAVRVLLTEVLAGGAQPSSVTLSLHPGRDEVEVSLVAEPGDTERAARLRRSLSPIRTLVEDAPDATWARALVPTAPGAVSSISGT